MTTKDYYFLIPYKEYILNPVKITRTLDIKLLLIIIKLLGALLLPRMQEFYFR